MEEFRQVEADGGQRTADIVVLNVEGELFTVWMNAVIKTRFQRGNVGIGDVVKIQYMGKQKSRTSEFYYKAYKVAVARKEG